MSVASQAEVRPDMDRRERLVRSLASQMLALEPEDLEFLHSWVGQRVGQLRAGSANVAWRAQVGPAYTQADVARLLGKSAQAVHKDPRLLVLRQVDPSGTVRPVYPVFQFTGRKLRAGVGQAVRTLSGVLQPESIASWLTTPRADLGDLRPADALDDPATAEMALTLARQLASAAA